MKHFLPDGLGLYYEVSGNEAAGRTIVFLNGLSQSTVAWSAVAPVFASEYRIVLLDLIFQGQSDRATDFRTYDAHAADVMHLLQTLKIEQPVVCGLSYGSAVAQHLLVNYPDQFAGGILLATFGHNTPQFNSIGRSWESALRAGGYPLMLEVMLPVVLGRNYFENPLVPIETLKENRLGNPPDAESLIQLMRATEARTDYRNELRNISAPVMVAQGEMDFLIPPVVAQQVSEHIPRSEFIVIPGVGHTLNLEAIPQINKLIRNFLETKVR